MPIIDLFSKRQKRLRGEVPDVFQYTLILIPLRVQLVHAIRDGIGPYTPSWSSPQNELYALMHKTLCKEFGEFTLYELATNSADAIANRLLEERNSELVIDIVEVCARGIDRVVRERTHMYREATSSPDDAIEEINGRFKEHGVGYEYVSGEMVRIDSQFLHAEVTKPALSFLADTRFKGANEEFLKAHEHYRHGNNKECLVECLKAFESTLKTICHEKNWPYNATDTAKTLLATCEARGLFHSFMQSHLGNLRAILEGGVPTARNKLGGHGQGATVIAVNDATARFALHTTATCILFFADCAGL